MQTRLEGIAARQFAEHDLGGRPAHVFGAHDLIGLARLEHAVLMDARGVGESVGAHHRLIRLHRKAGDLRDHLRCRDNLGGVDTELEPEVVAPGTQRHHHFLERRIAGALAQAIDGAFDLARTADHDPGQRVGHRQSQIIVAVDRPDGLVRVGNALAQALDGGAEHLRHCIADRVGEVDRGSAFGNDGFKYAA